MQDENRSMAKKDAMLFDILKKHCIVIFLYIVCAAAMTWPLLPNMTTHVVGEGGDMWQTLWRFEYKNQELRAAYNDGALPTYIYSEFLGGGQPQLVNHSVWPWMPFQWITGQPTAYNLVWFLSFVLSGYAMYWLVTVLRPKDEQIQSTILAEAPAFLAGIAYMFLPFHVAHARGHFGAMQMQWLPALFALTYSFFKRPYWLKALAIALLLIIQAWSEHHYLLWLVIVAGIAVLFFWRDVWATRRYFGAWLIIAIAVIVIGLSYLPTVRLSATNTGQLALGVEQTIRFSADPFAYIIPSPFHTLWGGMTQYMYTKMITGNISESVHFVGLSIILTVIFFQAYVEKKQRRFWFTIAAIFFVLSLGPRLHLLGKVLPIPLPYALLDSLPVFSAVRAVGRMSSLVGLSFTVLFGLILVKNMQRYRTAVLFLVLIMAEFLFIPVSLSTVSIAPAYTEVASLSGKTLLEIPTATNYVAASKSLYASLVHRKELLGNIALERGASVSDYNDIRTLPAVRHVLYVRARTLQENRPEFLQQDMAETFVDVARWQDIAAVVMHTDSVIAEQKEAVHAFLVDRIRLKPTVYEDMIVYPFSGVQTVPSDGVFAIRNEGWTITTRGLENPVEATIAGSASVTFINTNAQAQTITLTLPMQSSSGAAPTLVDSQGNRVEFIQDHATYQVTFSLMPGDHSYTIVTNNEGPITVENPSFVVH